MGSLSQTWEAGHAAAALKPFALAALYDYKAGKNDIRENLLVKLVSS